MVDQTALPQIAAIGRENQGGRDLLRRNKRLALIRFARIADQTYVMTR
jgi:hypothetical protein